MSYVSDWYKKPAYQNTYAHKIIPINPLEQWPRTGLAPMSMPPDRVKPGRPKKLRRLQHDEIVPRRATKMTRKYVISKCSKCGQDGHNIKTCFRREQENKVRFISVYYV